MSWHFSRALAEEYSAANSLDGELFAALKSNPTPQAFLSPDRMKAFSTRSLSGMTFAPLTESHGEELLMWFLADFRAKTLVRQGKDKALRAKEADCGENLLESLMKYDLYSHSWKTHRCSGSEAWIESSPTLPKWGTMRNGVCLARPIVEGRLKEKECLFWPSPQASDYIQKRTSKSWTAKGAVNYSLANPEITGIVGGKLNPAWIEALMNWPIGWTELKLSETGKFQLWQQQHGGFYKIASLAKSKKFSK